MYSMYVNVYLFMNTIICTPNPPTGKRSLPTRGGGSVEHGFDPKDCFRPGGWSVNKPGQQTRGVQCL